MKRAYDASSLHGGGFMWWLTSEEDVNYEAWERLWTLLGCVGNESLHQAALRIERGEVRASHRARRAARKLLHSTLAPWVRINRAAGSRRPAPMRGLN